MSDHSRSSHVRARKFILANEFEGPPKPTDFKLVEEYLSTDLVQGEILTQAEWLSVDPYMRVKYVDPVHVGGQLMGGQVARVIKSRCREFPVGSQIVGNFGWRDFTVYTPDPQGIQFYKTYHRMIDMKGLPDSYALGYLGMPGNTAYHGLIDLCHAKAGDVLVVNSAGGAVGSLVGQLGKMKGCEVLAFAGSTEKLKWMRDELEFDHVFDYKHVNLRYTLENYAPNGVNIFFDNVAGEFVAPVLKHMVNMGMVCRCGALAEYNFSLHAPTTEHNTFPEFSKKKLQLKPLNCEDIAHDWFDRLYNIQDLILEGKIKVRETVVESFENMPQAFMDLLQGKNVGKMVVKA